MRSSFFPRPAAVLVVLLLFAGHRAMAQGTVPGAADASSVLLKQTAGTLYQQTQTPGQAGEALEAPVDPETYILGPGDLLGISLRGGLDEIYRVKVSPDGNLMIPMVPLVRVSGLTLASAADTIRVRWGGKFPDAEIDITLLDIRTFRVAVAGAVVQPGTYVASPALRVSALVELAGGFLDEAYWKEVYRKELERPGTTLDDLKKDHDIVFASKRYATLFRHDGSSLTVDMLKYENAGVEEANPQLMDGDRLVVAFQSEDAPTIAVSGAVAKPGVYEWLAGDRISDLLEIAGGLIPGVKPDSLLLARFTADSVAEIMEINISSGNGSDILLKPGDLVLVRRSTTAAERKSVTVEGEVAYPGDYPVIEGESRLSDVVEMAGGLKEEAFLEGANVWRKRDRFNPVALEEKRLDLVNELAYNEIEKQFLRFNDRWRGYDQVAVDFNALFRDKDKASDCLLAEGDVIYIPDRTRAVLLLGMVKIPGLYSFVEGWTVKDYLKQAGGLAKGARPGTMRLVKYGSDGWAKTGKREIVGPGDIILVPEAPERFWWTNLKDVLTVLSQAATVVVVILSVTR